MRIRDVSIYTRHSVHISLEGCTERLDSDLRRGEFRPTHITLSWRLRDGAEWGLSECAVSGPIIKKNGEDGLATGKTQFAGIFGRERERPGWLSELIDTYETTLPVSK